MANANLAGEVIAPKVIILPTKTTKEAIAGSIVLSGSKIMVYDGTNYRILGAVTSTTETGIGGSIVISGGHILIHNGTNFVQLSGSNVA